MHQTSQKIDGDAVRTLEQARRWFDFHGISIADWALENGFPPAQVYAVLAGRNRGRRGTAHRIAVSLGLKKGAVEPSQLSAVLQTAKGGTE